MLLFVYIKSGFLDFYFFFVYLMWFKLIVVVYDIYHQQKTFVWKNIIRYAFDNSTTMLQLIGSDHKLGWNGV